jgi:hypothetical protein
MGLCKCTNRLVVGVVGTIFFTMAVVLLIMSVSVLESYGHLNDDFLLHYYTLLPAVVLLCVALFFALGGMLACCVVFNHNKCLLTLLTIVTVMLLVLLLGGGFELYTRGDVVEAAIKNETLRLVEKYDNGTAAGNDIDYIQTQMQCCGAVGPDDYLVTDWWTNHTAWPATCCQEHCTGEPVTEKRDVFQQGCYTIVYTALKENERWIAIGTGVAIAVLALGLLSTLALCCIRRQDVPIAYGSLTASTA